MVNEYRFLYFSSILSFVVVLFSVLLFCLVRSFFITNHFSKITSLNYTLKSYLRMITKINRIFNKIANFVHSSPSISPSIQFPRSICQCSSQIFYSSKDQVYSTWFLHRKKMYILYTRIFTFYSIGDYALFAYKGSFIGSTCSFLHCRLYVHDIWCLVILYT